MSIADIPAPTRIGPQSNGMAMTLAEYEGVQEWDPEYRYELVHGVLIVSPPPSIGERKPNDEFGYWLLTYRDTHSQGFHLDDTTPEHTFKTSAGYRRADRVIWAGLGRDPDYFTDIPTIAVEFVSDSSRDRKRDYIEKRAEYAEVGIREYWIIDRFRRTMTVFCGNETEHIVNEGDVYETDLLPGFKLDLSKLLAIADRVTKDDQGNN